MKTAIFFSLLSTTLGAAIQQRSAYVLGFEACTEPSYTGFCYHYENVVEGQCYSLVPIFEGQGSISSVRVDANNLCKMFPNEVCDPGNGTDDDELDCRGSYWDLSYPEIAWEGKPKSFLCLEGWS